MTGAKVDYQVAAPTELGTPTMHRTKIAQQRVRMEGWRQRRPGSNARNPQEGKRKQKEKNTLDSYRLLMEGVGSARRVTGQVAGPHRSACFQDLNLSASHGLNSS